MTTTLFFLLQQEFSLWHIFVSICLIVALLLLMRAVYGTIGWLVNRGHYDREWFWYYYWAPDDWWKPFAYPYAVLVLGGWHHMKLAIRDRHKDYENDPSPAERTQGTWGDA
jgi:hypothetical protein